MARDPNLIYWGFNAGYHKDDRAEVYVRECRKLGWDPVGLVWDSENKQDYGKHRPCVSPAGDFFLLPEWLFLTNKSGILNALAANYAPGLEGKDELFRIFVREAIEFLKRNFENKPKKGVSMREVFSCVRRIITNRKLKPTRPQIISNPDWSLRYLVCDNPRIDLQEITIPREFGEEPDEHPFPISWLADCFSSCEVPMHVHGRDDYPAAALIDVFLGDDMNDVLYVFKDDRPSLISALDQIGFNQETIRSWSRGQRAAVLAHALGYEKKRVPYYIYFEEFSRELSAQDVYVHVEQRTTEVLMAWIQSFCTIHETDVTGLFSLMGNPDITSPYTLGDVVNFVAAHRASMRKRPAYAGPIQKRLPARIQPLLTDPTLDMLNVLIYMRNDSAHPERLKNEKRREEIDETCKQLAWKSTRENWSKVMVRANAIEFFHHFSRNSGILT